jgi:hypothetical protein
VNPRFLILVTVATLVGTITVYLEVASLAGDHGMPSSVGRAQAVQVIGTRADFEPIVTSR